ncbi:hypothetical protein QTO34_018230 [Cnephaeus nilssonii]|uniref:Uncharacterized protein n=1 Tax=Cnephaeus nilssonii TaxID=3371016 RepID=A0AA40LMW5_CNENI|nr:hypothetical protein QTO34_018230 [Eptesicus nilssonii]
MQVATLTTVPFQYGCYHTAEITGPENANLRKIFKGTCCLPSRETGGGASPRPLNNALGHCRADPTNNWEIRSGLTQSNLRECRTGPLCRLLRSINT